MSELRSCVVEAMIRGYHEYQSIWEAEVGENLTCIREPGNVRDPYAVAVTKPESSTIVGHVPRKMSADEGTSLESAPVGSGRFVLFCFAKYLNRAISFHVQGAS